MITSLLAAATLSLSGAAAAQQGEDFPMLFTSAQPFTVNPSRVDPYRNFNFRVRWDGRIVTGVHYVSPLRMRTDAIEYRDGGDDGRVRTAPGLSTYAAVTLRRGLTHADEFEEWAHKVSKYGEPRKLNDYLKNVRIEVINQEGVVAHAWSLFRCWPSEYVAVSGLDALKDTMAQETLTIRCDGWERDQAVREPAPRRR